MDQNVNELVHRVKLDPTQYVAGARQIADADRDTQAQYAATASAAKQSGEQQVAAAQSVGQAQQSAAKSTEASVNDIIRLYRSQVEAHKISVDQEKLLLGELAGAQVQGSKQQIDAEVAFNEVDQKLAVERMARSQAVKEKILIDSEELFKVFGRQADLLKSAFFIGGTTAAIVSAVEFFKNIVAEADKYNSALARISVAIHNQGESYAQAKGPITAFADQMAAISTFRANDVLDQVSELISKGHDWQDVLKVIGVAVQTATIQHKDLGTVVYALTQAWQGNALGLRQLGISMSDIRDPTFTFNKLLEELSQRAQGATRDGLTPMQSGTAALSASWEKLQRDLGDAVSGPLPDAQHALANVVDALDKALTSTDRTRSRWDVFADSLKASHSPFHDVINDLAEVAGGLKNVDNWLNIINGSSLNFATWIHNLGGAWPLNLDMATPPQPPAPGTYASDSSAVHGASGAWEPPGYTDPNFTGKGGVGSLIFGGAGGAGSGFSLSGGGSHAAFAAAGAGAFSVKGGESHFGRGGAGGGETPAFRDEMSQVSHESADAQIADLQRILATETLTDDERRTVSNKLFEEQKKASSEAATAQRKDASQVARDWATTYGDERSQIAENFASHEATAQQTIAAYQNLYRQITGASDTSKRERTEIEKDIQRTELEGDKQRLTALDAEARANAGNAAGLQAIIDKYYAMKASLIETGNAAAYMRGEIDKAIVSAEKLGHAPIMSGGQYTGAIYGKGGLPTTPSGGDASGIQQLAVPAGAATDLTQYEQAAKNYAEYTKTDITNTRELKSAQDEQLRSELVQTQAVLQAHIADAQVQLALLNETTPQYKALAAAIKSAQTESDTLARDIHAASAKETNDVQTEADAAQKAYDAWANRAESAIQRLVENGSKGFRSLGEAFKEMLREMEQELLKSAIFKLFFPQSTQGQASWSSIFGAAAAAPFGGIAPSALVSGGGGGSGKPDGTTANPVNVVTQDIGTSAASKLTGNANGVPGIPGAGGLFTSSGSLSMGGIALLGGLAVGAGGVIGNLISPHDPGTQQRGEIGALAGLLTIGALAGPASAAVGGAGGILGGLGGLAAAGPAGWALLAGAVVLGGVAGGAIGPHWGPPSNYPDRSDTANYGQFVMNINGETSGRPGNFNGTQISAQAPYNVSTGGISLGSQLNTWEGNVSTSNLTQQQQSWLSQLKALGNDLNITNEKNGVFTLRDGIKVSVQNFEDLVKNIATIPGAPGSTTAGAVGIGTWQISRTYPNFNVGTLNPGDPYQAITSTGSQGAGGNTSVGGLPGQRQAPGDGSIPGKPTYGNVQPILGVGPGGKITFSLEADALLQLLMARQWGRYAGWAPGGASAGPTRNLV